VRILDVSGEICRLAEKDPGGNILITALTERVIDAYGKAGLSLCVIDPRMSFGPGEDGGFNDAAQALITAGRRLVKGLGCCIRFLGHTGKQGARERPSTSTPAAAARHCRMAHAWWPFFSGGSRSLTEHAATATRIRTGER
jgi:RecA-family ATPase